jgi:hypothetical protein
MGRCTWSLVRGLCAWLAVALVLIGFGTPASAQNDEEGTVVEVVLSDPVTVVSAPLPENPTVAPIVGGQSSAPLVVEPYPVPAVPQPAPVTVAAPDPHAGLPTDPVVGCILMAPYPCTPLG